MLVTYLGHAAIMLEAGGARILMDPWLTDPSYDGAWWHFPPLELGPRDLPRIDYLYISHEHPDHFDPPTLRQLDRNIHVLIANFRNKRLRTQLAEMGFRTITELPFEEPFTCGGGGLTVRLIAPDRPWDDSAILLQHDGTTVMNVNDCHLDEATLQRLGSAQRIDLAFLTFTGASQYPGCFDFPIGSKIERALYSKHSHLAEFVHWAQLLNARRAVPAAGNHALLAEDQLFLNTPLYGNTPAEAIEALRADAPHIEGLQMNPGDTWTPEGGHVRHKPAPDWSRRMELIEELSRATRAARAEYFAGEAPAPADLWQRFASYFTEQLERDGAAPRINLSTWWTVTGPQGGEWQIDFTRERDWVRQGVPENWNLHITIPDTLVFRGVTGQSTWDHIVLSFRVRLSRRPDRYMKEFWTWFCKL